MLQVTEKEVRNARRIYWVILGITPFALVGLRLWTQTCLALLYPFIILLIIHLLSNKPFQKAHAAQGLVLALLLIALSFLRLPEKSLSGFLFTLLVWLVGSIVGLRQAGKGRAWIGKIRAEILPDQPAGSRPVDGHAEDGLATNELKALLEDFRSTDPARRATAAGKLEELGQVETF